MSYDMPKLLDALTAKPKIHVTYGLLSPPVNENTNSAYKWPFNTIAKQCWSHTVEILIPDELYKSVWPRIEQDMGRYKYHVVVMSLSQILEEDFFGTYVKSGNISMLSEGHAGLDSFFLRNGVLRLEISKERYERSGLVGKPISGRGRKHISTHFAVTINLREPSMIKGKNGFDRIVWAFRNELKESLTWLLYDHNSSGIFKNGKMPLALQRCTEKAAAPSVRHHSKILIPPLEGFPSFARAEQEEALELLEWIDLVTCGSPRVRHQDSLDPFLSRYCVPNFVESHPRNVVGIRWRGFLSGSWVEALFTRFLLSTQGCAASWFALSSHSLRTEETEPQDGYTILCLPEQARLVENTARPHQRQVEYILWKMAGTSTDR